MTVWKRAGLVVWILLAACATNARAQTPTNAAQSVPPLTLSLNWDSAPHNLSTSRNLQTLYGLYGRGADKLFGRLATGRDSRSIFARLARSPLDAYVAWLVTIAGHEFGHCQAAWLAGSRECHWIRAPGPYALGHIISIGDTGALTPAGRQSITTGGTQASVAGADDLKREMFLAGQADWTAWPALAFRQLDLSLYGLTAPSPANATPLDYANDMTNYAVRYGTRSGLGGEAVHRAIVRGAIWNLADPMTLSGVYTYFVGHVIRGERTARVPGLRLADRTWMVTTNAWLSEVGVRSSLGVLSRGTAGDLFEVTPSWGEGQPAMSARWSHDVRSTLRAGVSGDLWRQRAGAASGPLKTGGSFGASLSRQFGRLIISGDVGYKSVGVMLARPHDAGWFFSIGSSVRVRR